MKMYGFLISYSRHYSAMSKYSDLRSVLEHDENDTQFLFSIYEEKNIPFGLRETYHAWIDSKDWTDENQRFAAQWFEELISKVNRANELCFIPIKNRLKKNFDDPLQFFKALQECLKTEQRIIETFYEKQEACKVNQGSTVIETIYPQESSSPEQPHRNRLNQLSLLRGEIAQAIGNMEQDNSNQETAPSPTGTKSRRLESDGLASQSNLYLLSKYLEKLCNYLNQFIEICSAEHAALLSDVMAWRNEQKFPIGELEAKDFLSLDVMQKLFCEFFLLCEECMALTIKAVPLILKVKSKQELNVIMNKYYTSLLEKMKTLVRDSIIIEMQPPQLMKLKDKESKDFAVILRCLLPSFKCPSVLYEAVEATFFNAAGESNNSIKNNSAKFVQSNGIVTARFNKLIVKDFKTLPCDVKVAEQKYYMSFKTTASIKFPALKEPLKVPNMEVGNCPYYLSPINNQLTIPIQIKSLSIVARTSHTSQECNCMATIIWDNAFRELNQLPESTVRRVSWKDFINLLKVECFKQTRRILTQENIEFFKEKLIGPVDDSTTEITWKKFNEETIPPNNSFTFWRWYHATLNFISKCLPNVWRDNKIIGYITKQRTNELMSGKPNGTFLLRFSETYINKKSVPYGALSVAVVLDNEVAHGNPFFLKELYDKETNRSKEQSFGLMLTRMGIEDELLDKPLLYLYPREPINVAFADFMDEEDAVNLDGYLPLRREQKMQARRRIGSGSSGPISPMSSCLSDAPLTPSTQFSCLSPAPSSPGGSLPLPGTYPHQTTAREFSIPQLSADDVSTQLCTIQNLVNVDVPFSQQVPYQINSSYCNGPNVVTEIMDTTSLGNLTSLVLRDLEEGFSNEMEIE
ncbi:signal transducer and activator of transcription 1-alpha/beta-like isoform X2 [Tubulanus polymorphus]|uniref:signal transducer and activator of transcription 1-alpha/beta-like isoform X2 n=1 Tax=Tubulanus polymorphus TaxID=672921 RepID=UPI003DA302DD